MRLHASLPLNKDYIESTYIIQNVILETFWLTPDIRISDRQLDT